jgi:hypothetical protein
MIFKTTKVKIYTLFYKFPTILNVKFVNYIKIMNWLSLTCLYSLLYTPHCFKPIAKATACGWKEPVLSHLLNSTVVGERGMEICLIKKVSCVYIIIKAH